MDTWLIEYLNKLHSHTGRNVVVYYSGWLIVNHEKSGINDLDMNGFMAMFHGLDVNKGLDLILHTEGGVTADTESIINYIYEIFKGDVRAIVPQLAMSGGTIIACSCKEIIMGKQSSLGPIDPQLNGAPAQGIIEEFKNAKEEIKNDPSCIPLWQQIISKYPPTLLDSCYKSIDWSNKMLKEFLCRNMFKDEENRELVDMIVDELGSRESNKGHDRHISLNKCLEIGLKITPLEDDQKLQDYVLTIHHACMEIFGSNPIYKIICSQNNLLFFNC